MFSLLNIEHDGPIATVRLDRVGAMNALSIDLITELIEATAGLEAERELRVVVFTSNDDRAFVAGADVKAMAQMSAFERAEFARLGHELMHTIEALPQVTVAAVNGFCLGGGFEFALSCDLIAAGPKAQFGFPEVSLGLVPGFGGTQRFPKSVGMHRALGYILSGERFGVEKADQMGMVSLRVDETADFLTKVMAYAAGIAANGPRALAAAKQLVRQGCVHDARTGTDLEVGAFGAIGTSDDAQEGMDAFLQKRKPAFHNR